MTSILYALVCITSAIIIEILLNRSMVLHQADNKAFIRLLVVSFVFCFVDAFWGFLDSHTLNWGSTALLIASYGFHGMAAITAYSWLLYVDSFLGKNESTIQSIIGAVPLTAQIVLLLVNIRTDIFFFVNESGDYISGRYRIVLFLLQYACFMLAVLRVIIEIRKTKDLYRRKCALTVLVFAIVPTVTGVLQMLFPYAPFYSIGFMLAATVIFVYNVSAEHAHLLSLENQMTRLVSRENREMVNALAGIYMTMYRIDLINNFRQELQTNALSDDIFDEKDDAQQHLNHIADELVSDNFRKAIYDFVRFDTLPRRMAGQKTIAHEFMSTKAGWCRASFIRVNDDPDGNPEVVIFAIQHIDEEKRRELDYQRALEKALENQNEVYAEMLQVQSNGIVATDLNNKILKMNDAAAKMFGYPSSDLFDGDVRTLLNKCESENKQKIIDSYAALKTIGGRLSYEFAICVDGKNYIYVMATSICALMTSGERIVITSLTNITRNKNLERELTQLSETDALTNIRNRGSGENQIEQLVSQGTPGMFALMDVDKFKTINDTFGHGVGDKVLIAIANCLKKSFRGQDIVMRLGGDEFAVYAVGITKVETAKMCIERLFDEIDRIDIEEMRDSGRKVTISLGAVLRSSENDKHFDELYQTADGAMYESKKIAGNHYGMVEL